MLSSPGSEVRLRNILSSVALLVVAATAACAATPYRPTGSFVLVQRGTVAERASGQR